MDRWDSKPNFGCNWCMYYVPKRQHSLGGPTGPVVEGRCRRNGPTMQGYPVVYSDDWCGEHKRGSNPVRERKAEKRPGFSPAEKMMDFEKDHGSNSS